MVTGANQVDRQVLNPPTENQKELVRLIFPSVQAKREFLERYWRELPKNQQGPFPSKALIDRAIVIKVDEAKWPLQIRTDRVKTPRPLQINQISQHRFAGPFRQRKRQQSSLLEKA